MASRLYLRLHETLTTSYETFSFVQVTRERGTGRPVPRLMVWNDNAGRAEPLPLISP